MTIRLTGGVWLSVLYSVAFVAEQNMGCICRTVLAAAIVFLTAGNGIAAPTATLKPTVGPPTTTLTVAGTGYGAYSAVDVFFDTTDLCLTFANSTGAVSCVIRVPRDAQPQQHWISLRRQNTGTGAQRPFTVRTDMAQFHGRNAAHAGVNPFENALNVNNVGDLDTLWAVRFHPWGSDANTVVAGGKVYLRGLDGKLYAFYAATGAPVSGFPVNIDGSSGLSSPAVGYGRVFIGGIDSKLHAFDAATGAAVSGFPAVLGGAAQSTPSLALGNVYVGSNNWKLYAFNAKTGSPVSGFPVNINGDRIASPTVANGIVYIGSSDNNIYAFNALTGATVPGYFIGTGGDVNSTVAIAGAMGFVGSNDHSLRGFEAATGKSLSGFPVTTGLSVASSPAVAGGKVYFVSDDGVFYANFTSGGLAWSTTLDGIARGSPVVANGVVYTSSLNQIYALSAASGKILWSSAVKSGQLNSPTVANGIVYCASTDGYLYAFSVNGLPPAARLPGGVLGVEPAISSLKPDHSLNPGVQPALAPPADSSE